MKKIMAILMAATVSAGAMTQKAEGMTIMSEKDGMKIAVVTTIAEAVVLVKETGYWVNLVVDADYEYDKVTTLWLAPQQHECGATGFVHFE